MKTSQNNMKNTEEMVSSVVGKDEFKYFLWDLERMKTTLATTLNSFDNMNQWNPDGLSSLLWLQCERLDAIINDMKRVLVGQGGIREFAPSALAVPHAGEQPLKQESTEGAA